MTELLFPLVEKYITETDMLNKHKGNQAQIYRILGQGNTKSRDMDMPPAVIERKMELVSFKLLNSLEVPEDVRKEIDVIKQTLNNELVALKKQEVQRRLCGQVLHNLSGVKTGNKDNNFYAGRLVLVPDKAGLNWAWCLTPYYPIISQLPPDPDYLVKSYEEAEKLLDKIIMPADIFNTRLNLSWMLAKHFSIGDKVLIIDVAKMFKVAGQPDKFWTTPKKCNFIDLPDAAFIANLINWIRDPNTAKTEYNLVAATVHQAHGPNSKVYYMPSNIEGTQTRPVVYIEKRN